MRLLFLIILFNVFSKSFAQDTKAIDATTGVGDYKFCAPCESLNSKIDEYGWYNIYPNLEVGGLKVNKVKIACNDVANYHVKGIYWIELYFESKTDVDYKKVCDQLFHKYGPISSLDYMNDARTWEGKFVSITCRHEDSGQIVVVYDKKQATKKVGF
jgi:hypothetical protein